MQSAVGRRVALADSQASADAFSLQLLCHFKSLQSITAVVNGELLCAFITAVVDSVLAVAAALQAKI